MNNDIKSQLQQREFLALKNEPRIVLKWATGCGKSKMAIDLVNNAVDTHFAGIRPVRVLFVVAERAHIQNWQDEFDKWHLRYDRVSTDVWCYASLHKFKDAEYDIVIFDECHHAFSEKRLAIIETIKASMVMLLSATLPSGKLDLMEEIYGKFAVSSITLKDAIKSDILSDPRVYLVDMELDDKRYDQEIVIGKDKDAPIVKWEERNKYIFKNIPCRIRCTQKQKYIYYTNIMEYWKNRYEHSHNEFQRTKWVNTGSQRKRFLGELKTAAVYNLINSFPKGRRFVCFCASVNQATSLHKDNTISSKRTAKYNQLIINAFNAKRINQLYAVGMITEGMNLTDIQTGIIVQLDGKERLFIQKAGRVFRADTPIMYIIYFKDTQDEVYLKQALENIEMKYIKHISINHSKHSKL